MKTIIVATDFSINADSALKYALEINQILKAKIVLFHSYQIFVDASNLLKPIPTEKEIKNSIFNLLENQKHKTLSSTGLIKSDIELVTSAGPFIDQLLSLTEKKNAELIILGTKGVSSVKEIFMGTNTFHAIERVNCPLIAIPQTSNYHKINKIVFATNYVENDFENINKVVDFAKYFNAQVIMLHVETGKPSKSYTYNQTEQFFQHVKESTNYENLTFKLIENKNVEEAISLYLDEIKADLFALTNRQRSLFQKLFDHSLTSKIINHIHLPLMVFHVKERGNYFL